METILACADFLSICKSQGGFWRTKNLASQCLAHKWVGSGSLKLKKVLRQRAQLQKVARHLPDRLRRPCHVKRMVEA